LDSASRSKDGCVILNWIDLERLPHALPQGASLYAGARVLALGYMMETDQPVPSGKAVRDFLLLPDAGNALEPAHRFGDQMIAVHLPQERVIAFRPRSLVWVCGFLKAFSGDPKSDKPLYSLQ